MTAAPESPESALAAVRRYCVQDNAKAGPTCSGCAGCPVVDSPFDCVFCSIATGATRADIVDEGETWTSFPPRGPHVPGHLLFIPRRHVSDATVEPALTGTVFAAASAYLGRVLKSEGNILTSVGAAATQTVKHLHVHVIPRGPEDGLNHDWPWLRDDRETLDTVREQRDDLLELLDVEREQHVEAIGMRLIRAERQRQIDVEGYTSEHDIEHGALALVHAANNYRSAGPEAWKQGPPRFWPWEPNAWKPRDPISNLVRAGALYLAASDLGNPYGERNARECAAIIGEAAAAILAATPTAARIEAEVRWADLAPDEQTRIGRDVANAYQAGLADGKRNSATRIAQLEAEVAAARSALGAVEAVGRETCREWPDDDDRCDRPAEFILWGKLFPLEALGPRCYGHAMDHTSHSMASRVDQWAVFDLRPIRAALATPAQPAP